jgi:glycosyltransferase involved in cell wall biosynthesis
MHEADLLLHPKFNDPCPRLVVEAMACGLPIVYSHSGGVPELVGPDAGVGVPAPLDWENDHPPTAHELAVAIESVLENHVAMSIAARERAIQHLDVEFWRQRHHTLFNQIQKR